jgi:hypothetical protein
MRFIVEGSESLKKKVGGTDYGYIYFPKAWIGSEVTIIRNLPEGSIPKIKPPKNLSKFRLFAKKRLKAKGFEVSDEPINVFGEEIKPLVVGTKGKRTVIVSGCFGKELKSKDVSTELSEAANVLYIVISRKAKITESAAKKIKELANVILWRYLNA